MCFCSECHAELAMCDWDGESETCDWDGESETCDRCRASNEAFAWIESTVASVLSLAEKHGWTVWDVARASETRSRYIELSRDERTIKVRVSDHSTMYCTEDVSLAMTPGPDDHTIETLIAILN